MNEKKNKTFTLLQVFKSNPERKFSKYSLMQEMVEHGFSVREFWIQHILDESVKFGLIDFEIGTGETHLRKNVKYYTWKKNPQIHF